MKPSTQESPHKKWTSINFYQAITNSFIKAFHQGTIPWRAGTAVPFHDFAQNYYSAHMYQGINWLQLNLVAAQETPYYLTWNQTQMLGGSVLRGTKATTIFSFKAFYKTKEGKHIPKVRAEQLLQKREDVQRISYLKPHQLFNVMQTKDIDWELSTVSQWKTLEQLLKTIKDQHKITYETITQSCYDPTQDVIILPEYSQEEEEYNYVLFIHLIHWTGHESRLARDGIMNNSLDCGYDIEEQMVADIGASMLARLIGMELNSGLDRGDEEMLSFWIQALEENNRFILRVASKAQKAIQYLLSY